MARRLVSLAVLLACHSGPVMAASRPAGTGQEPGAAEVLWAKGKVNVVPKTGAAFGAAPGMKLYRSDELAAPLGGFLVVELANGYLARVDEEITLFVRDLALLDAPAAAEDRATQLGRLLSQGEAKEAGQRVVGYHAGMRASESRPSQLPKSPQVGGDFSRGQSALFPRDIVREEEPSENAIAPRQEEREEDGKRNGVIREPSAPQWRTLANAERAESRSAQLPEALARALAGGQVAACLQAELARSGVPFSGPIRLMVRLDAGTITLVRLAGGIAAGACAEKALLGVPVPKALGRRWMVLELPR